MVHILILDIKYFCQIQYVFETIFSCLEIGCTYHHSFNEISDSVDNITIVYGSCEYATLKLPESIHNLIFIKNSTKLFGKDYLKPDSIPLRTCKYKSSGGANEPAGIISIYNDGEPLYIRSDEGRKIILTNIDIISDIFFMLTRYEEVVSAGIFGRDKHDRFPALESLAYKNNFLQRPIVNEHIDLLWSWIDGFSSGYKRLNRWGEKTFAVCISHDVDHVLKNKNLAAALRHTLAVFIKFKSFKKAINYLRNYYQNKRDHTKDPYWAFQYLIDIEKKYKFCSSFYFMASEASDPDYRYDINDSIVRGLIHQLEDCGCEIGYHGSILSYNNKALMDAEKTRIDGVVCKKPYGSRQHYLKFQVPVTWRYQSELGILYDTTLSFADYEGFRCGMCLPFKPFDILEGKVLDIWEIPLLVMEGTLQSSMYRNLSPEDALKNIIRLIETVKKHQGVFSVLWHNSSFDYNWEGWSTVFEETMRYLGDSDCISLSGREIIEAMS